MQVIWIPGDGSLANAYLRGNVLVDAGVTPMQVAKYRDQIEWIVLTHCHFDHIAHAHEIAHMCDARLCMHKDDAEGLGADERTLAMIFGERAPPLRIARTLRDGDEVEGLRVIHTPGHTPGGICLWDGDERNLFSGDTVFADGGVGRTDFPGGSIAELKASLGRLSALDVKGLYPGHGPAVESNGALHINAALRMLAFC